MKLGICELSEIQSELLKQLSIVLQYASSTTTERDRPEERHGCEA